MLAMFGHLVPELALVHPGGHLLTSWRCCRGPSMRCRGAAVSRRDPKSGDSGRLGQALRGLAGSGGILHCRAATEESNTLTRSATELFQGIPGLEQGKADQ